MASTVAINCPNCGAELYFNADKQLMICDFCESEFTDEEIKKVKDEYTIEQEKREAAAAEFTEHTVEYECPNCGSEVITDDHTVADICIYCHSPVMAKTRMSGVIRPDKVIPFKYGKDAAIEKLTAAAKRRWFVPKDFFSKTQMEKIQGIYYPFWVTDADTVGMMNADATRVRVWRSGNVQYTETSKYRVERQGNIHFEDITSSALSIAEKEMVEGILPYPSDALEDFTISYLSGFQAKKRDIEREAIANEVKGRMNDYASRLLKDTIKGYATVNPTGTRVNIHSSHWEYSLLPIWMLTYKTKNKSYPFAMNGYTGKIYGSFPLDKTKLGLLCGTIFMIILFFVMLYGGLFS